MARIYHKAAVAAAVLLFPLSAQASDDHCTSAERSTWRTHDDVAAAGAALGYQISRVEVEGTCYEAYARDDSGRRLEIYFDPTSLKIVRIKDKSR